jgi:hypothetical protein
MQFKSMHYIQYNDGKEKYVTSIIHSDVIHAENKVEATTKAQLMIGIQVNNNEYIGPLIAVTQIKTKS